VERMREALQKILAIAPPSIDASWGSVVEIAEAALLSLSRGREGVDVTVKELRDLSEKLGVVPERSAARSEHQSSFTPCKEKTCHPSDQACLWPLCQSAATMPFRSEHQSAGRDSVLEEAAKICDGYYAKPYDQFDRGFAAACKSLANHFRSLKQEGGER
jgi:hypothetical protein